MHGFSWAVLGVVALCALAPNAQAGFMAKTSATVATVGADSALGIEVGDVFPVTFVANRPPGPFRLEFDIDLGVILLSEDLLDVAGVAISEVFLNNDSDIQAFNAFFRFSFGGQSFRFDTLGQDGFVISRMIGSSFFVDVAAGRFAFPAKTGAIPEPTALGLLGFAGLWSLGRRAGCRMKRR